MKKSKKNESKNMEEIVRVAANNYRYRWGIQQLEKLGRKNREMTRNYFFLCNMGFLYDHLALKKKGQERKKLEDKAIKFYQKAIKINPKFPGAVWGIGRVWWHRKSKRALPYAKKAIKLAKQNKVQYGIYVQNVGFIYESIGDYKNAEKWLLKGMKIEPNNWACYSNLVKFYNLTKQFEKSKHFLKKLETLFEKVDNKIKNSSWGKKIKKLIENKR